MREDTNTGSSISVGGDDDTNVNRINADNRPSSSAILGVTFGAGFVVAAAIAARRLQIFDAPPPSSSSGVVEVSPGRGATVDAGDTLP